MIVFESLPPQHGFIPRAIEFLIPVMVLGPQWVTGIVEEAVMATALL